jgi:hypothetical protein
LPRSPTKQHATAQFSGYPSGLPSPRSLQRHPLLIDFPFARHERHEQSKQLRVALIIVLTIFALYQNVTTVLNL